MWEDFYKQSFFFRYLLDYSNTVSKITDLSHLWCVPVSALRLLAAPFATSLNLLPLIQL